MLEVELKSIVDDMEHRRAAIEAAGAQLVFSGRLEDRRYDTADRTLTAADQVLRVRTYRDARRDPRQARLLSDHRHRPRDRAV
jgi:adenylate cyclase class IV